VSENREQQYFTHAPAVVLSEGQRVCSVEMEPGTGALPMNSPSSPAQNLLLQNRYRELMRNHLNGLAHKVFKEFTTLRFHIAWMPAMPHEWTERTLPTGGGVCRQLAGCGTGAQARCAACGRKHLVYTLRLAGKGHRFICHHGILNYWLPIIIRDTVVGLVYLQAQDKMKAGIVGQAQSRQPEPKLLTQQEFYRATRLLRLVVHNAQTLELADLELADLASARQAILALESEQARLRAHLSRNQGVTGPAALVSGARRHADQVVDDMLQFLGQNYPQPLTLKEYATRLGMNAAYLSSLFSRKVGIAFKSYLTELRLEKARALLLRPGQTVTAVAEAVGYSSENRFRLTFKKRTGLSPRVWRETLQVVPPRVTN
jgi:AraC-like DNA-binding protein